MSDKDSGRPTVVFTADAQQVGCRLDSAIAEQCENLTRNAAQQLIAGGYVRCNGLPVQKSRRLCEGDRVEVQLPEPVEVDLCPQKIPLDIVYEDDSLLVINKPKGMVVHPAPGNPDGTLVNALLYHCGAQLSGINGEVRPGIVHRIDKDTSGLLVVAKTNEAHLALSEQLQGHHIDRIYRAVCYGGFSQERGTVDAPIGRHPTDRKKMAVGVKNARTAVTHYQVLEQLGQFSYIECKLETGRTHQIRVHMASIGHPLAGDEVYGPQKVIRELNGQCLHAYKLSFVHPVTRQPMTFETQLPAYFTAFLQKLRKA